MNLLVKRVFGNDVPEHEDVIKRRMLHFSDVDSIEECITNDDYIKLYLKTGEEIIIKENFDNLIAIMDEIKEEEKRNDIIG